MVCYHTTYNYHIDSHLLILGSKHFNQVITLFFCFRNPPKGEWTSSNSGFMNGFFKSKHGKCLDQNISAFISTEPVLGPKGFLSPNSYKKKLLDFSSGVVSHVKSYYNTSLWQTTPSGTKISSSIPQSPIITPPSPENANTAEIVKTNDYSDVIISNNNNEAEADKKIESEPEKEPKMPQTLVPAPDSTQSSSSEIEF